MQPTPITLDGLAPAESPASSAAPADADAFAQLMAALVAALSPAANAPAGDDSHAQAEADQPLLPWPGEAPDTPPDAKPDTVADLVQVAAAQGIPAAAPLAAMLPSEAPQAAPGSAPAAQQEPTTAVVASAVGDATLAEGRSDTTTAAPINSLDYLPTPTGAEPAAPAASPEPARTAAHAVELEMPQVTTAEAGATAGTAGVPPRLEDTPGTPTSHPSAIRHPAVSPEPFSEVASPPTVTSDLPAAADAGQPHTTPPAAPRPPVPHAVATESGAEATAAPAVADAAAPREPVASEPPAATAAAAFQWSSGGDEAAPPPADSVTIGRDLAPAAQPTLSTPLPARPVGNIAGVAEPSISDPAADLPASDEPAAAMAATAAESPPVADSAEGAPTPTPPGQVSAVLGEPAVKSVPTMARTSDGIAVAEPGDGQAGSGARALTDRPVPEVVRASAQETHRERPGPALTGAAAAYAPAAAVLHEARETVTVRAASRTPLSEQVAHAIARAVDDGQTQVAVRLEPPLLGTVRVTITMSDSGDVSAQLNASTELGRRVLDTGLPRLAAALADRGVDVGQLNVSVGGHESPAHFFDHSPGWQQPARAVWTPPAGIGLTGDGDPAEPIGPAWYGHHLIDLLA